MPNPDLWTNTGDDWYARLESGGKTYGLARRRHEGDLVLYEGLDRYTGDWIPATEGAGYFTGIGGVTDAVPCTPAEAATLERALGPPA